MPATLVKPTKQIRTEKGTSCTQSRSSTSDAATVGILKGSSSSSSLTTTGRSKSSIANNTALNGRTLQAPDLLKLAKLNCSREFSLFHQYIKSELSSSYENQLAFLQTKLQHLKNEFTNKQAEHLNFEQIREYYKEAVQENVRRRIKPDEFLTLSEKLKTDVRIVSIIFKYILLL